jgi:hypothetical protein
MTAILYPVAGNADDALKAPLGRAARQREAEGLAGQKVAFVTEAVGPVFATRDAALDAFSGRLEDDRPGQVCAIAPEDRWLRLAEQLSGRSSPAPVKPAFREGRRWPAPPAAPPATVWRVQASYWRPVDAAADIDAPQARKARRGDPGAVDPDMLRAISRQPLRPVIIQRPLDIGLFERRLPENPNIVVPDE